MPYLRRGHLAGGGGVGDRYDVTQSPEQPERACADNGAFVVGAHPGQSAVCQLLPAN